MFLDYSLCPNSTVYVPIVQFISSENSLCPYIIVYVQRVQFEVLKVQFMSPEYSLCP